jgi:DNA-3-methyladenine glycosylase II
LRKQAEVQEIALAQSSKSVVLSESAFVDGLEYLCDRDPDLAWVIDKYGKPPFWQREPGFPTLVYIILEQQVSLASAKAAYDRLCDVVDPLNPSSFLALDDATLKAIGFSRQKMSTCRVLSLALLRGELDLRELENMNEQKVRSELVKLKGIGLWTANIYLLMALRRPDIWPDTDLAILVAIQKLKTLNRRPDVDALREFSDLWRPWRAVAARILWHYYLNS